MIKSREAIEMKIMMLHVIVIIIVIIVIIPNLNG